MKATTTQFDTCTKDRFVDVQSAPGEVRLAPSLLVTNEMGVNGKIPEELSATNWAKVAFDVPSAALEGALCGIRLFAISLVARKDHQFGAACGFAEKLARMILAKGLPGKTFLNVNVPGGGPILGVRFTRQGKRLYRDEILVRPDASGRMRYFLTGPEAQGVEDEGTDFAAIARNEISVTPLQPDLTGHSALDGFAGWLLEP